jgi:hypothetical protein
LKRWREIAIAVVGALVGHVLFGVLLIMFPALAFLAV